MVSNADPESESDTDTERALYLQRIDPDHRDEYLEAHDDVPNEVTQAMERGGVEEFQLFVRDEIAVCLLEVADLESYNEIMANDPAVEEWERYVAQFKTAGVDVDAEDDDEQIPYMNNVWSFES